jgi:nitroimidazol reductase NimA-like FMN-containing flavoprotein (pyridoxamine 5'-phosphate oxidase superfamily)
MARMPEAPSERTQIRRHPERGDYERASIDAILDEALICHLAWVSDEGTPRVIPTIHVRVGDTLYVHGSAASRTLRSIRDGRTICLEATLIDGLVLARSTPLHSMNYRSVVVYGVPREVTDPAERDLAQLALVEHVVPGRTAEVRMPSTKELKETAIFAVGLDEASAKIRTGPPLDPEEDLTSPAWAGVLPVRAAYGDPVPSPDLTAGIQPPPYVIAYRRPDAGSPSNGEIDGISGVTA